MAKNKILGNFGESIAEIYLNRIGYKTTAKNYRCKTGEIDLILIKNKFLIFAEVKTRTSLSYGYPQESVNFSKIKKIKNTANCYLSKNDYEDFTKRFDVISITVDKILFYKIWKGRKSQIMDRWFILLSCKIYEKSGYFRVCFIWFIISNWLYRPGLGKKYIENSIKEIELVEPSKNRAIALGHLYLGINDQKSVEKY